MTDTQNTQVLTGLELGPIRVPKRPNSCLIPIVHQEKPVSEPDGSEAAARRKAVHQLAVQRGRFNFLFPWQPADWESQGVPGEAVSEWELGIRAGPAYDWWVTLTFPHSVTRDKAMAMWDDWISIIQTWRHRRLDYLVVVERDDQQTLLHLHAFVGNTGGYRLSRARSNWKGLGGGITKIEPYYPNENGARYLAEKIVVGMPYCTSKNLAMWRTA